ncbi:hypothetical protein N7505_000192 [Penicillium chrysogenum]|uniref:Uncharacterized protein n=1 Tax=Penicillium chrysogenum TaxID=5076 RepID=A0ABQ8WTV8_PENCH|nr:hypothetical protein N7505_000192 [Penicillium chrysogenum]
MPSTWSACWTRSRNNNAPAPGRRGYHITSRGLAIQHNSYHLRVQQADHATLQPPAPGSGEHYMISRELARWSKYHLHGQPAGHAVGTTRQPLGDGDIISSPGG